ncbi:MAG: SPOR domain-containing protein [Prevotella sp.]|nr:SPOR domain-containing protein [Prevotella sp.]
MKKYTVLCAGLCVAMAFTSCKSSQSAYKQAYLKAKAQEEQQAVAQQPQEQEVNVVAPLQERPVNNVQVVDNADNINVRQESVSLVSGSGLKAFSVVVGSFGLKANAENLQGRLQSEGYNAQIVKNEAQNMYRVVATTFDSKADAAASRNALESRFNGAWLLYQK